MSDHPIQTHMIIGSAYKGFVCAVNRYGKFLAWPVGSNEQEKDPDLVAAYTTYELLLAAIGSRVATEEKAALCSHKWCGCSRVMIKHASMAGTLWKSKASTDLMATHCSGRTRWGVGVRK